MDEKQLQLLWELHAKKGGFSSFDEFKGLMGNGNARKAYFDNANPVLKFKDINEFEGLLGVKKKDGGNPSATMLQNVGAGVSRTSSQSQLPEGDVVDVEQAAKEFDKQNPAHSEYDSYNPIDLVNQSNELSKKQVSSSSASSNLTGTTSSEVFTPDKDAQKKAADIDVYLDKNKINKKEIKRVFGGMPDEAYSELGEMYGIAAKDKDELFAEWESDKIGTESKINNIKTHFDLVKSVYNAALEENYLPEQAIKEAKSRAAYFMNLHKGNVDAATGELRPLRSIADLEQNIIEQQRIVNENLPHDKKQVALERIKNNTSIFINSLEPTLIEEYNNSPLKGQLTADEYAGLKTLKLFSPLEYDQAIAFLSTPLSSNTSQKEDPLTGVKTSQRVQDKIAIEGVRQKILNINRENTYRFAKEKMNNAETEEEKFEWQGVIDGIVEDEEKDVARFPYLSELKFERLSSEALDDAELGVTQSIPYYMAKGFGNSAFSIENVLTSIFGSDEDAVSLERQRYAEGEYAETRETLPSRLQSRIPDVEIEFGETIKSKIKIIKDDTKLSRKEKFEKAAEVISQHQDEVKYVTNNKAGESNNFFSMATVRSMTRGMSELAVTVTQSSLMGGAGAAKLLQTTLPLGLQYQNVFYGQAIKEGRTGSAAMEYANANALIVMASGLIQPDKELVLRALGKNVALKNTVAKIPDAMWRKVVSNNKGVIEKIKNAAASIKNSVGASAKMAGGTYLEEGTERVVTDMSDKNMFGKNITNEQMISNAHHAGVDAVVSFLPLLGVSAITNFKSTSPLMKAQVWQAGLHKEMTMQQIDDDTSKGTITAAQGKQRKEAVEKISLLISKVPRDDIKGKPLTDEAKVGYLWNLVAKDKAKEIKADLPKTAKEQVEKAELEADDDNEKILSGVTVVPLKEENKPAETIKAEDIVAKLETTDKIPEFEVAAAKGNPDLFLEGVADQTLGYSRLNGERVADKNGGREKETREKYGDEIVDAALQLHPETKAETVPVVSSKGEGDVNPTLKDIASTTTAISQLPTAELANLKGEIVKHLVNGGGVTADQIIPEKISDYYHKLKDNKNNPIVKAVEEALAKPATKTEVKDKVVGSGVESGGLSKLIDVIHAEIPTDNTKAEKDIHNIIQKIHWGGGDVEKLYKEWENLGLQDPELKNNSEHFYNFIKSKYPQYDEQNPTQKSQESDTVKKINNLIDTIIEINGEDEVSKLYDEYEKIKRPDGYEYNNEADAINFLQFLKEKKGIKTQEVKDNTVQPKTKETNENEVTKLEKERDDEIEKVVKPDLKLELVSPRELVASDDPIGNKAKHNEIKDRYIKLKKLIECL